MIVVLLFQGILDWLESQIQGFGMGDKILFEFFVYGNYLMNMNYLDC